MPSKKDVQKRRVAAAEAAEAQQRTVAKRDRRRRMRNGAIIGVLAFALVASLAGIGLIAILGGDDEPPPLDLGPQPVAIEPIVEGLALSGTTPCPATDGTQLRTTAFEEPPGLCIDPELDYDVELVTAFGDITVTVDPSLDAEAANLFVTMARYGLYDGMPFTVLVPEGLAVSGDPGDINPGFSIPAAASAGAYEIGSVVMFADLAETIASRFAFVTGQVMAETLSLDPLHPAIGTVTAGAEVLDRILATGSSSDTSPLPVADLRIDRATVTELG